MIPYSSSAVEAVFNSFPDHVRPAMIALRDLIFTTAQRVGVIHDLSETLKWREPSYVCKTGSTVRIGWKESDPDRYGLYFHCQTTLIETFRELYPDSFEFDGNRAICLSLSETPDFEKLGHCIEMSLKYHTLKALPRLGN